MSKSKLVGGSHIVFQIQRFMLHVQHHFPERIQVLRKGGGSNIFDVAKYIGVLEVRGGGVACMSSLRCSYRDSVIFETKIFVI